MEKGSDSDNLGDSLIKSVTQSSAGEIDRDVSEMALVSALKEGLLKNVEVFGWLGKLYAFSMSVRDHIFLKKVASFLFGTLSAHQTAKDKFRKAMDANKTFGEKSEKTWFFYSKGTTISTNRCFLEKFSQNISVAELITSSS